MSLLPEHQPHWDPKDPHLVPAPVPPQNLGQKIALMLHAHAVCQGGEGWTKVTWRGCHSHAWYLLCLELGSSSSSKQLHSS